jgi:hypothetical protein
VRDCLVSEESRIKGDQAIIKPVSKPKLKDKHRDNLMDPVDFLADLDDTN